MLLKPIDCHPSLPRVAEIARAEVHERERRKRTRVQVHWPLSFFGTGAATEVVQTATDDLSSEGFYCVTNIPFIPGEIRECILGVPASRRNGGDLVHPIHCRVRVIRVAALGDGGPFGIGCQIEDYRFVRSESRSREVAHSFTEQRSRSASSGSND